MQHKSRWLPTGDTCVSRRKNDWRIILFFTAITVFSLIGTPLYIYHYGLSLTEILLFVFYVLVSGFSITIGYHRLFAHRTYTAPVYVKFILLFFGASAFEQSALRWASQHREHHRNVDTVSDPYSIKKGFFYAHMGWLMFWEHDTPYDNAKDLSAQKLIMHQHNHYMLWSFVSGIFFPLLFGICTGHLLGAFILSVCLRLTWVYHLTFFINSVCHIFGKAPYDTTITAKDNWLIAFFTYGEGYHNFHHRFSSDYRNAIRWYQWDPSKWLIYIMAFFGMAKNLRRMSTTAIHLAKYKQ